MARLAPTVATAFALLWAYGWFRRQTRRSVASMGNTALGLAGIGVAITWLWKNRRDAISAVAASVLAVSVLAVAAAWWLVPEWRLTITAPVLTAGLCAGVWWDYQHTKGAPLMAVLGLKKEEVRVRRAVQDTHENARPRSARKTENGWRVDVDHTGALDPELVGQRLQVGGASVVPTDRLGRSTIVLDDKYLGEWEPFRDGVDWVRSAATKPGAPVPFAVSESGADVTVPWPGSGGTHLLGAGSTGSGKSVLLRVLIAEMAYRENVTLVLADPKMVEFRGWSERAHVARGVEESGRMFDAVFAEMMRRYETMPEDQVEWTDADGDWIELVVDELGGITTIGSPKERAERERMLGLILSMGRAAGIGVVGFTQRPSHNVLSMDLRDNFRVRIGLGCESQQQTAMVMGDSADKAPCTSIPESLPGACFVRVDRKVQRARVKYLDPSRVREIAAETAKNKGAAEWLVEAKRQGRSGSGSR